MARARSVAEIREELEEVLTEVEQGQVVTIQRGGKVIAEIRPATNHTRLGRMAGTVTFLSDVIEPLDEPWGESR